MSFTLTVSEYYKLTSFNNTSSPLLSLNTNIHTYIPWIHTCVAKTVGCGPIHKYTNIDNVYSVKYYIHFTKQYYRLSLHIKNSSTEYNQCVFRYFLDVGLNSASSFLRMSH